MSFLFGCADGRFIHVERDRATAGLIEDALAVAEEVQEAARNTPEYPDRCRIKHHSGVTPGERQDTALVKTDNALARQHRQTDICAAWFDDWKAGIEGGPQ
ncbi:hypothetical protein [Hoeflea sp.]|uniref:hypothetical protein n=1 Tax=Hoeflea sp. TaxID=1940281 RepID=UPI003749FF97